MTDRDELLPDVDRLTAELRKEASFQLESFGIREMDGPAASKTAAGTGYETFCPTPKLEGDPIPSFHATPWLAINVFMTALREHAFNSKVEGDMVLVWRARPVVRRHSLNIDDGEGSALYYTVRARLAIEAEQQKEAA